MEVEPDGDGELSITVAEPWRGRLGTYLLDTLLAAAVARGVPNLEAEIMVANAPMLALARARDCVLMERPDWTLIRVLIGTIPPSPTWPGRHDRTRVPGVPVCLEMLGSSNVSSDDVPLVTGYDEEPIVEFVQRLATERR